MAATKKRLGRGLDSLISGGVATGTPAATKKAPAKPAVEERASSAPSGFVEIPITDLTPNPYQPRKEFAPEAIDELAESIRGEGLLQPIVVRSVNGRYEIVAGERRWRACQQLRLKKVTVRVVEANDASSAVLSLVENLQREGLNPIEEALGFASLMRDFDLTQEAVATRVGKSRTGIANSLRLLHLGDEIQGYLSRGLLSVGHAKVLLSVEEPARRELLARKTLEEGWSVRELERKLKSTAPARNGRNAADRSGLEKKAVSDVERRLSSHLNAKVQVQHGPKKGKVSIEYHGNEDLQRILEKMGLKG